MSPFLCLDQTGISVFGWLVPQMGLPRVAEKEKNIKMSERHRGKDEVQPNSRMISPRVKYFHFLLWCAQCVCLCVCVCVCKCGYIPRCTSNPEIIKYSFGMRNLFCLFSKKNNCFDILSVFHISDKREIIKVISRSKT